MSDPTKPQSDTESSPNGGGECHRAMTKTMYGILVEHPAHPDQECCLNEGPAEIHLVCHLRKGHSGPHAAGANIWNNDGMALHVVSREER